ncbi:DUF3152 domain-containing protein [Actinoplanes teichomyceticus]|uniref:Uncharacterized protein DUF3152 n=1 Tax=Actinoplanes teichomyceticus TaxID=1867 RepID=A0A561VQR8_ACTTI|nr:DUF3152 domain-containing protein [Actinoplanes teichomyceticus]TWG13964.1 uncharacterized protein DUF3152 [Actinoplanes teichomyceticus]GIF12214.1 hypothetical protein Ate01nite_22460 [Actinoplanes teichomyceticus]
MIAPVASVHEPETPPPTEDRWRQWWLALFAVTMVLLTVVTVAARHGGSPAAPAAATPSSAAPSAAAPLAPASPAAAAPTPAAVLPSGPPAPAPAAPSAASAGPGPEVLQIAGAVPAHGSGDFQYAVKRGPVLGSGGPVRRFRVAVEKGSGEDPEAFAAQVVSTLGDPRSWIGDRTLRLRMVGGGEPADFTVYLATRDTAGRMCQRGGTNIRIGGVPYTSCRTPGQAIINLDRYRKSARPYLAARVPLAVYRNYVINHEVGHELGHHHEGCPRPGGPAPVMVQQTLTLRGCVPYAWPRRDGKPFAGPRL